MSPFRYSIIGWVIMTLVTNVLSNPLGTPSKDTTNNMINAANTLVKREGSGHFSAGMISLSETPTQSTDVATKGYVDSQSGGSTSLQNVGSQAALYKDTTSSPFELRTLQGDDATGSIVESDPINTNRITVKTNAATQSDPNTIVLRDADSKIAAQTLDLSDTELSKITINGNRLFYTKEDALNRISSIYVGTLAGSNISQINQTAIGYKALENSTANSGACTAVGALALQNSQNFHNTAIGYSALKESKLAQFMTALGTSAGENVPNGNTSIYIGALVKGTTTPEDFIIRIGDQANQTACYIGGITNIAVTGGQQVYIDASGKLGTATSSFDDIEHSEDMKARSAELARLKPVSYTLKEDGKRTVGLIAEDARKIIPEMVFYDQNNKPISINYNLLRILLLKELQKFRHILNNQQQLLDQLKKSLKR